MLGFYRVSASTPVGKEQEAALVHVDDAVKDIDACGVAEGPREASCV